MKHGSLNNTLQPTMAWVRRPKKISLKNAHNVSRAVSNKSKVKLAFFRAIFKLCRTATSEIWKKRTQQRVQPDNRWPISHSVACLQKQTLGAKQGRSLIGAHWLTTFLTHFYSADYQEPFIDNADLSRELITEIIVSEVDQEMEQEKAQPLKVQPFTEIEQIDPADDVPMEVDEIDDPHSSMFVDMLQQYGSSIFHSYLERERCISDPLKDHEVLYKERKRLMRWLKEVCEAWNCTQRTYFLTVAIIDTYFSELIGYKILKRVHLHLIGVTALFMASKYEGNSQGNHFCGRADFLPKCDLYSILTVTAG